jgi:hypothetical protein
MSNFVAVDCGRDGTYISRRVGALSGLDGGGDRNEGFSDVLRRGRYSCMKHRQEW